MPSSQAGPLQSFHRAAAPTAPASVPAPVEDASALSELARTFVEIIPRAMWSMRQGMREAVQKDLSVPQFRAMAQLWKKSRMNGELAEQIGASVPAMSRLVDGLVDAGYVVRIPQDRDRRQVKLELSLAGRRAFRRLQKHTHGLFVEKFSALDSERRKSLLEGLKVLEEVLSFEALDPPKPRKRG